MPRPANPDEFAQINFITNYYLLGCSPPTAAFFEFAREPTEDLAFLLFAPDLFDIGQEILDPSKGRRRKPARHGRKRPRFPGLPDTSAMIGGRLNRAANIGAAIRLTPLRWILPLWNIYEGVTFTVAVLEGVTDIFFTGILGVVTIDNNNCKDLDLLRRSRDTIQVIGGRGPPVLPINLPILDKNKGFMQTQSICRHTTKPYEVMFQARMKNRFGDPDYGMALALHNLTTGEIHESRYKEVPGTNIIDFDVSAQFGPNEVCSWGVGTRLGFFEVIEANVIAYSLADFPWN
jgi:hypothetical protein